MGTPKKPVKKPTSKPTEEDEDINELEDEGTSKKKFVDEDDDDFDLPIDDIGGFEATGFDDEDDDDDDF